MQHEPFWCLREREEGFMAMAAEPSLTIRNADKKELPTKGYSKKAWRSAFCWAEIDQALFLLMQNKEARAHLRVVLISTFLLNHPQKSNKIAFPSCLLPLLCFLAS